MRNLSVNGLPDMKPGEVADLPVAALADLQAELNHQISRLKVAKTVFDVGLQMKYADRAGEARRNQGKDTGTARFEDGEYTVV